MRDMRLGICAVCEFTEVVECEPLDHAGGGDRWFVAVTETTDPQRNHTTQYGELLTYTCLRCGYTQWFARRPELIPIGIKNAKTRLIQGPNS